jgi:hypothetical protein
LLVKEDGLAVFLLIDVVLVVPAVPVAPAPEYGVIVK